MVLYCACHMMFLDKDCPQGQPKGPSHAVAGWKRKSATMTLSVPSSASGASATQRSASAWAYPGKASVPRLSNRAVPATEMRSRRGHKVWETMIYGVLAPESVCRTAPNAVSGAVDSAWLAGLGWPCRPRSGPARAVRAPSRRRPRRTRRPRRHPRPGGRT